MFVCLFLNWTLFNVYLHSILTWKKKQSEILCLFVFWQIFGFICLQNPCWPLSSLNLRGWVRTNPTWFKEFSTTLKIVAWGRNDIALLTDKQFKVSHQPIARTLLLRMHLMKSRVQQEKNQQADRREKRMSCTTNCVLIWCQHINLHFIVINFCHW